MHRGQELESFLSVYFDDLLPVLLLACRPYLRLPLSLRIFFPATWPFLLSLCSPCINRF